MASAGRLTRSAVFVTLGLVACALRLLAAWRSGIIEHDGAYYASLAAALLRGDVAHGLSTVWPPFFPCLIAATAGAAHALGAALTPELLESAARGVSVAAGVATLVPLERLARSVAD